MAKDPYRYFRIEARELLEQLGSGVLELEKGVGDAELPARLLRYAHTLKGAALVVRQAGIAELAHTLEDALAAYRDGSPAREGIDGVLGLLDAMSAQLTQLALPDTVPDAAVELPDTSTRVARTDIVEVDMLLDGLGEVGSVVTGMRLRVASLSAARAAASSVADRLAALRGMGAQAVDDALAIESLSGAADQVHKLIAVAERSLDADIAVLVRELREARDTAERLRLSPASGLFGALERTARDAARSLAKNVSFFSSGGEVRLDAQVLETIQSALVQMVRNAVAHGIEMPAERVARGKAPAGRIAVDIERRGLQACFRCSDDGRGVDLEAVRHALERKGMLAPDMRGRDATDLIALLLRGGISTASNVSEISGRGIGLDVVRDAVRQLGGQVSATTTPGGGTTVELRVPASLAALDVLQVQVDGQRVAIPLEAVRKTLRVAPADVTQSAHGSAILHDGALIPLARVELGAAHAYDSSPTARVKLAVVVAADAMIAALGIDKLLGIERVVLRPLPAMAIADALVAGTYLDADGNPRIVLDAAVLASGKRAVAFSAPAVSTTAETILIVDDSLTTRMLESSILESAGFSVALAASGEEALASARGRRFGLFLVDVEMPGMSGFEFIERTRADPALADVPCILVTSRDSPEDRSRGEAAGASAYIVKGAFEQAQFLECVGKLVRR